MIISIFIRNIRALLAVIFFFVFSLLTACGGGGSNEGGANEDGGDDSEIPVVPETVSVGATFVKGLVDGASCELFEVEDTGASGVSVANGTTNNGVVNFGDAIEYEGSALISCVGGTYTDEASGSELNAPLTRAVVEIDGDSSFTVSPLTEIATQLAESAGDLGEALTVYNDSVAADFGLSGDITIVVPTDLETTAATNNDSGQYASVLALISQLNENDTDALLSDIVGDLAADLEDDGELSDTALTDLASAETDLATSSVAGNLSDDALATITDSAGIPEDETVDPPEPTTVSVAATFVKGPVDGASCELLEIDDLGASGASVADGTTSAAGVVNFGDAIEYEGNALISCVGGTYADEATGNQLNAPLTRAVVDIDGDSTFTVSPLTEMATQLAESSGDLSEALTSYNDSVGADFGLSADITATVPTDLETTAASNDDAGQYASVLALISQLNEDDTGASLANIVDELAADLEDDGELSEATLTELSLAETGLATSSVAGNLSDDALVAVTASAGIPQDNSNNTGGSTDPSQPNILVIISDDQGVDASAEYDFSLDPPTTPTISGLAAEGVTFQNVWAAPACAPTRAAILTGKHGVNNGVSSLPGDLNEDDEIIHEFLADDTNTESYASAFIGKWHLAGPGESDTNPIDNGIPYFAGVINGNIDDYDSWDLTIDSFDTAAATTVSTEYNTSELTDLAEEWIASQNDSWMLMLAYNAPHSPLHWPDESLHTRTGYSDTDCESAGQGASETRRECFLAMIEAMDTEIGNLLDSLSPEVRDNTIVMYVGDNGTPGSQRDTLVFDAGEVKNTLFEGGVRVPLVVSGAGVSRADVTEDRLVTVTDIYATVAELAGSEVTNIYDSKSFAGYLSSEDGIDRQHAYSDYLSDSVDGWTIRNANHQLIQDQDIQTLYALNANNFDITDVTLNEPDTLYELQIEAARVRGELPDFTANAADRGLLDITDGGDNSVFSVRASTCARYVKEYTASISDAQTSEMFTSDLSISVANGLCTIETNGIPNHDVQEGGRFATPVSAQNLVYQIPAEPEFAETIAETRLGGEQGIFLNGVKIDLFAAACLGVENESIGCGPNTVAEEDEWRFDPMAENGGFGTDIHNAHTQPSGAYHYHGNPNALYDQTGATESGVVGFAADGFPIYGSYISENGQVRKVNSSYQLKAGNRPELDLGGSSATYSEQPYDGTFRQDYEYVAESGDLDECNGMTVDGEYGYYITDGFPYIVGCFKGTPDDSF